jgi:pectate lyase
MVGWATQNGGTTGGAGGATVTVTNVTEFFAAIRSPQPLIIRVAASLNFTGMQRVSSHKTILGVGANSTIIRGGLNLYRARNIIVRNIYFKDWLDDAINVENSTNVWVDHNTFNHGYDGCVDIKTESDFVTVSWNLFLNHDKVSLVGAGDNSTEDIGHLRVTYHHNWFNRTVQRHPRIRFGNPVHVFNNYYVRNSGNSIASTMNAGVLVEGNYFDNVNRPFITSEGSSPFPGRIVERNNVIVNSKQVGISGGTVAPIPYAYSLDSALSVVESVKAGAGVYRNEGAV